jgi:hypothetical protein
MLVIKPRKILRASVVVNGRLVSIVAENFEFFGYVIHKTEVADWSTPANRVESGYIYDKISEALRMGRKEASFIKFPEPRVKPTIQKRK